MTDSEEFRDEEQGERVEEANTHKTTRYEMMLKKASPRANVVEIENDEEEFENDEFHRQIESQMIKKNLAQKYSVWNEEFLFKSSDVERAENEKLTIENQRLVIMIKNLVKDKDDLVKEHAKKNKEIQKIKNKCDVISSEYMQIMSERDIVHKEIEALQEKLSKFKEEKLKSETFDVADKMKFYENKFMHSNTTQSNRSAMLNEKLDSLEMIEALKHQLNMISKQRDDALSQVFYYKIHVKLFILECKLNIFTSNLGSSINRQFFEKC